MTASSMVATTSGFAVGLSSALLYLLGTVIQIRRLVRAGPILTKPMLVLAVPALVLHGLTVWWAIDAEAGINLGIYSAACLVAWVLTAFLLVSALRLPVQNLVVLVFPISALSLVGVLAGESSFEPLADVSGSLLFHILTSLVAYGILFMAACQSVALAVQEHYLRARRGIGVIKLLPPLETMETLLFLMLWTGLAALTVAIVSGFLFLEDMFAQQVAHHTVFSSASWLIYLVLLAGHRYFGWRGTTAVRWALIAFALLVLGYFGSKFVLEIVLQP